MALSLANLTCQYHHVFLDDFADIRPLGVTFFFLNTFLLYR